MKNIKTETLYSWIAFVASFFVFVYTCEPVTSYWDSGEYLSTTYKLQVGHPPGAPFFQLTGRILSFLSFGNLNSVAFFINLISAVSGSLTVFFIFKIALLLLKSIIRTENIVLSLKGHFLPLISLSGALTFAFSDSFWTSSTETEVYTMSLLLSSIIFWLALKYYSDPLNVRSFRSILLMVYFSGISLGVHQLSLLVLPASFMLVALSIKGINGSLVRKILIIVGFMVIPLAVALFFIPFLLRFFSFLELTFVNKFDLPFNSGLIFGAAFLLIGLLISLILSALNKYTILNKITLCLIFFTIGISSYLIIPIRANSDLPINLGKPDDVFGLKSYYNREVYEKQPLIYGPYFNAPIIKNRTEGIRFVRDESLGKYMPDNHGFKTKYEYSPEFMTIFPRMWNTEGNAVERGYKNWGKIEGEPVFDSASMKVIMKPTFSENLRFFFNYQLGNMYFRYLLWNFSGKQNDRQHFGGILDGNWITGFVQLDRLFHGPQIHIPEYVKTRGFNRFFMIPLVLGLIGLVFLFKQNQKYFWVLLTFFMMYSIALVIYFNQYFPQPRERDYPFLGSFFVYSVWISIGLFAVIQWISKYITLKAFQNSLGFIILAAVPANMIYQGWDDHNRHHRMFVREYAASILDLCNQDAILFTFGDNDTYPLWYLQEVENYRTDIRIINVNLLNDQNVLKQLGKQTSKDNNIVLPQYPGSTGHDRLKSIINANLEKRPVYFSYFIDHSMLSSANYQIINLGLVFQVVEKTIGNPNSDYDHQQIYKVFIENDRLKKMIGTNNYLDENMRETGVYIRDFLIKSAIESHKNQKEDTCNQMVSHILNCFPMSSYGPSMEYLRLVQLLQDQKLSDEAARMADELSSLSSGVYNYYNAFGGWQKRHVESEKVEIERIIEQLKLNLLNNAK